MSSTTLSIRVPVDVSAKLARLAAGTRRSRSYLAAEAVAAYVERELAIIEGVEQGLADVAAERTVPHDVAMAEIDALIDAAEQARAARG